MAQLVKYDGNISIWEASTAYRHEVERYLKLIGTTRAGETLFRHIKFRAGALNIYPYKPGELGAVNAYTTSTILADEAPLGYIADTTKLQVGNLPAIEFPTTFGTGKGTNVDLFYHPATWNQLSKNVGHLTPGNGPGEVLYHEMVHALRQLHGVMKYRDKMPEEIHMESVEEFYSIMAGNVYRSERGFTQFNRDHRLFSWLPHELHNPDNYYDNYKVYIDKWFADHRAYCMDMARSPAKFNPFLSAARALGLMPAPRTLMKF